MKKILLMGGFKPGQSLWSIKEGFELSGWEVVYLPTRGCIASHHQSDASLAQEEADIIPAADEWDVPYADEGDFQTGLCRTIETHKPSILLWWFSKDDRPAGLIEHIRQRYPECKTVTHTQDDPWDLRRSPQFSAGFEYAVTCCKQSVAEYAQRGIKAIVLYPPPAESLHRRAKPVPGEVCDFSVTLLSLYSRSGGDAAKYLQSPDPLVRITHPIAFPDQRVLRQDVVDTVKEIGRLNLYGGLGYGTFADLPRSSYRGFRNYYELPQVYASAKININHHNSPRDYGYMNQRDTAITGSGGFMLTDYVAGMEEVFEIGKEIDTYESLPELRDKARWWLEHDVERLEAQQRAQQRIFAEYGNLAYVQKLTDFVGVPCD